MNPGGRDCSQLRSPHCTPASVTEQDFVSKIIIIIIIIQCQVVITDNEKNLSKPTGRQARPYLAVFDHTAEGKEGASPVDSRSARSSMGDSAGSALVCFQGTDRRPVWLA